MPLKIVLPAFAIEFFTEHADADVEHSKRQTNLCAKYLDSDALKARALEVAEQACRLRWASITDLYRRDCLGRTSCRPASTDQVSPQPQPRPLDASITSRLNEAVHHRVAEPLPCRRRCA